jgi:acetyl esterase/lipase
MPSWQMTGVAAFVRLAYRRRYATAAAGQAQLAKAKGPSAPRRALTRRCAVERRQTGDHDVYVVRSRTTGAGAPTVIYLHGGAYTHEIVKEHWALVAHLAEHAACAVHVPIYGLAPRHHGLEALDLVTGMITDLTRDGRACYLVGDSAGGGLALSATQRTGAVTGLTLIAPWLDLSMSNPGIPAVERIDPWLNRAGLRPIAAAWANGLPLTDPRLSPLYGDLDGLPPLQVLVGTRDITLPDCRALRDRIRGGSAVTYHEQDGAIHNYPLLPVPEAHAGRRAIVDHLRAALGA